MIESGLYFMSDFGRAWMGFEGGIDGCGIREAH